MWLQFLTQFNAGRLNKNFIQNELFIKSIIKKSITKHTSSIRHTESDVFFDLRYVVYDQGHISHYLTSEKLKTRHLTRRSSGILIKFIKGNQKRRPSRSHSLKTLKNMILRTSEHDVIYLEKRSNDSDLIEKWCLPLEKNKKSTQRISFHPSVQVKETVHVNDYSDEEIKNCWFTTAEYRRIKADNQCAVDQMFNGSEHTNDEESLSNICLRGLESSILQGANRSHHHRIQALYTVLQEQSVQAHEGVQDEYSLAKRYKECTYKSKMASYLVGISDAKASQCL